MSADSSWELQQAIYGALTGDSTLMALITGVHDHVPQEAAFPYVTIGESTARAWGAAGVSGIETTLVMHVWSRQRGHKEVKQIMAEIHRILHDADLTVPGHVLVWLRHGFSQTITGKDGATYHGIAQYALTNQA
ncbi:MAG: DUF3168 domain-containing protein [Proteobacteria bacterium]|nr:DUF3168 domain-containing protein [Pseudomonadota bacterium]